MPMGTPAPCFPCRYKMSYTPPPPPRCCYPFIPTPHTSYYSDLAYPHVHVGGGGEGGKCTLPASACVQGAEPTLKVAAGLSFVCVVVMMIV
jgi:hypothetical protein